MLCTLCGVVQAVGRKLAVCSCRSEQTHFAHRAAPDACSTARHTTMMSMMLSDIMLISAPQALVLTSIVLATWSPGDRHALDRSGHHNALSQPRSECNFEPPARLEICLS